MILVHPTASMLCNTKDLEIAQERKGRRVDTLSITLIHSEIDNICSYNSVKEVAKMSMWTEWVTLKVKCLSLLEMRV